MPWGGQKPEKQKRNEGRKGKREEGRKKERKTNQEKLKFVL